jgi:hypothetical protein
MKKLLVLLSSATLLLSACDGDSTNDRDEETGTINTADSNARAMKPEPPADSLSYTTIKLDTLLGDCNDSTAFPPCTSLNIAYPGELSGSARVVRDSVENMVFQYIFEGDSIEQFFAKYTPTPVDSLDESLRNMPAVSWEINNELTIEHNTPELLTVKYQTYQYTGGAHGSGSQLYFNLDPATGQAYRLEDFLKEPAYADSLNTIAEIAFRNRYDIGNQSLKGAGYWFQNNEFKLNENFTITEEGLNFLFNAYEITSYAAGTPELFIPWQSIEGIIDESSVPVAISKE